MDNEPRSSMVTVTGWLFAVLSAGYFLLALTQNLLFSATRMPAFTPENVAQLPPALVWMLAHVRELVLANLVLSALSLLASIGLLLRKEWGRLLFIAMMVVGVAWNIAVIVLQFQFASAFEAEVARSSVPGETGFATFFFIMKAMVLLFCSAFGAVFGWIAWRLAQPDIRREFGAP